MPNIQALGNVSPADFPVGSPESRGAARLLLDARVKAEGGAGVLVRIKRMGIRDVDRQCTCKPPAAGTFAICRCFC
jgi:hypothetical protein